MTILTQGGNQTYIQNVCWQTQKRKEYFEDIGVDWMKILKIDLKGIWLMMQTGLKWLVFQKQETCRVTK